MTEESNFLDDYKQQWQQDGKELEQFLDIPLETLHENIARHERQRHRRVMWVSLSAAACLAFAVTTGIRYLTSGAGDGDPVLVAESRTTVPGTDINTPTANSWQPSQEGTAASQRAKVPAIPQATGSKSAAMEVTPMTEEDASVDEHRADPKPTMPAESAMPVIGANAIETTRLVAMGERKAPGREVETDGLVKIVQPSRNTFREAIVEPLLALATSDM